VKFFIVMDERLASAKDIFMKDNPDTCVKWYDSSYSEEGIKAQRLYPNEELCRFLGRNYFSKVSREKRSDICILEIGCGSCSNLRMIASEGFDTHGVDFSETSPELGEQMLRHWGVPAKLSK
jgi:2-polyprenyl-3-methyl-5-hydroxy-6-metoxy-1,4-benzoquinol methylase